MYDSLLGYVPRPGRQTGLNIGANRLRLNGEECEPAGETILAVGDSFTFGDEVLDHETWPAQLEKLLKRPVVNGGVSGYGVDQAVLRAERLMVEHKPKLIILSIISGDIGRSESSYVFAGKPYFELNDGKLILRNVPVPTRIPRITGWRSVVGFSHLAKSFLGRVAPDWMDTNAVFRKHDLGEEDVCMLLERLADESRQIGAKLTIVTLCGRIPDISRLPAVTECAQGMGLGVIDLAPYILQMTEERPGSDSEMFQPEGHLSPTMNAWVAMRIVERRCTS